MSTSKLKKKSSRRFLVLALPLVLSGLVIWKVYYAGSKAALQKVHGSIRWDPKMKLVSQKWLRRDPLDDSWHWEYEYSTTQSRQAFYNSIKSALPQAGFKIDNDDQGLEYLDARNLSKKAFLSVSIEPHPSLHPIANFNLFKATPPQKILIRIEAL